MHHITINFKDTKTLQLFEDLSKYWDFTISKPKTRKEKKLEYINGVPYVPGDKSIDLSGLSDIFTGRNLDARKLRNEAWTRKK